MIWLIVGVLLIVVFFGSIGLYVNYWDDWRAWIPIFTWFVLFIIAIFLNGSNCGIVSKEKISLYSGSNGNEISGSFFLGSGTIDETDYVYYWVKDENSILTKNKIEMSFSQFIEDGNQYLEVTSEHCTSKFYFDFSHSEYLFHVPENSVAQMYIFR